MTAGTESQGTDTTAGGWLERVRDAERRGDFLAAYDLGQQALELFPEDVALKHRTVLALARSGATRQAREAFLSLGLDDSDEEDLAALEARLVKDDAAAAAGARSRLAGQAARLYEAIFENTGTYYPGINAATMWLLARDRARTEDLARRVRTICREMPGTGGSISYLYFADRVYQLPLAVVGIAVGIALLPLLTSQLRAGNFDAAQSSQSRAIEFVLLLTLPAAAALMVISGPIVTVLFQHGTFGAAAADATADALSAYASGLPAYVLIKALAPGYFAREDTRTPVKIAVASMIANVALAVVLMQFLAHVGIALATALTAWFNAGFLAVILVRRGHLEIDRRLRRGLPRLVLATAAMAAALWWANGQLAGMLAGGDGWRIVGLAILVCGGAAFFAVLAVFTGAVRLADLKAPLTR